MYRVFKFRGVWYVFEETLWNFVANFDSHFVEIVGLGLVELFANLTVFSRERITVLSFDSASSARLRVHAARILLVSGLEHQYCNAILKFLSFVRNY